jgi:hypothetical protein
MTYKILWAIPFAAARPPVVVPTIPLVQQLPLPRLQPLG